jgi:hypothetical protein
MSAIGRVFGLTRSLHDSVARMERSAIRGRRKPMNRSRITLPLHPGYKFVPSEVGEITT